MAQITESRQSAESPGVGEVSICGDAAMGYAPTGRFGMSFASFLPHHNECENELSEAQLEEFAGNRNNSHREGAPAMRKQTRNIMMTGIALAAALTLTSGTAEAGGFGLSLNLGGSRVHVGSGHRHYSGYGHRGHSHRNYGYRNYDYGHRGRSYWHDTSHYDYHPGGFQRHYDHYHDVPGHYDNHRTGHWHHR